MLNRDNLNIIFGHLGCVFGEIANLDLRKTFDVLSVGFKLIFKAFGVIAVVDVLHISH